MSKFAKISFNGRFLCSFPIEKLSLINESIIKHYYTEALTEMIQDAVVTCFNELLAKASRSTKPGGEEVQLIEALKESIQFKNQLYINGEIGILSLETLDRLLRIKSGKRSGVGWWRVLESKKDEIVNNEYMFIPRRGIGKFKEGVLVSRDKISSSVFKPHKYSIKDKRYVTRFVNNLAKETIDNDIFMDNVMLATVSRMLYDLNLYSGVPKDE
jgi:hypothetical protein